AAAAGVQTWSGLRDLQRLFLSHEDKNVAPFVNILLKLRDVHGRRPASPPIALLHETLIKLETCLRSADAKKAADDVAKLAELLEGCGQSSVNEFVSEAHKWLAEANPPKAKRGAKTKSARPARKKTDGLSSEALPPPDYVSLLKQTA